MDLKLIASIASVLGILISIATLIYKSGKQAAKLQQNTDDIKEIKENYKKEADQKKKEVEIKNEERTEILLKLNDFSNAINQLVLDNKSMKEVNKAFSETNVQIMSSLRDLGDKILTLINKK